MNDIGSDMAMRSGLNADAIKDTRGSEAGITGPRDHSYLNTFTKTERESEEKCVMSAFPCEFCKLLLALLARFSL